MGDSRNIVTGKRNYWSREAVEKRLRSGKKEAVREIPIEVQRGFLEQDFRKNSDQADLCRKHFVLLDKRAIRRASNLPDPPGER